MFYNPGSSPSWVLLAGQIHLLLTTPWGRTMLPKTSGKRVVPSLLDHPCCHSIIVSELHTALPLYPFSSPSTSLQVGSSANFRECWWLTVQCCSPKSQPQTIFLTYPSGCLVASSSLLHPGYAHALHAISVQQLQATTSPSPSGVTSFLQLPLHSPLLLARQMQLDEPPWSFPFQLSVAISSPL